MNRNTGGVSLTDAGAVLLEEARDILERVDMAAEAAREAEAGRGGRLIIGSLGAISASFLPASLPAFRARCRGRTTPSCSVASGKMATI